jgi:predicted transcriptional regulator
MSESMLFADQFQGRIKFRVPTMPKVKTLKIREVLIFARLKPLKHPVSVLRLTKWMGGFMDRQTVLNTLKKLETENLAKRVGKKWEVIMPQPGDARFVWPKVDPEKAKKDPEKAKKEAENFATWVMYLPVQNPFKGKVQRGSLEKWVALSFYWHLRVQGKKWKPLRIARTLGLDRHSVTRNLEWLREEGLLKGPGSIELQAKGCFKKAKKTAPQPQPKAAPVQTVPTQVQPKRPALNALIDGTVKEGEILDLLRDMKARGEDIRPACEDIVKAFEQHRRNGYPGDGSALALDWLKKRASTFDRKNNWLAAQVTYTPHEVESLKYSLRMRCCEAARLEDVFADYSPEKLDGAATAILNNRCEELTADQIREVIEEPSQAKLLAAKRLKVPFV